MAILIDDVKLDLKGSPNVGTKEEKLVKEAIEKIREEFEGRFPLLITYGEHMGFKQVFTTENWSRAMTSTGYPKSTIPTKKNVEFFGTQISVRYADDLVNDGTGNLVPEPKRKIDFDGKLLIPENKIDLAFYMLYCYPDIDGDREIKGLNKIGVPFGAKKTLVLIDSHKENVDELKFTRLKSKVEYSVSNEMTDDGIKNIAISYGIEGATHKPPSVLRNDIIRFITIQSQTGGGIETYDEFNVKFNKIMDEGNSVEMRVRGLVLDAKERKMIRCAKVPSAQGKKDWSLANPKSGSRGERLCFVMPDIGEVESLITALITDEDSRVKLEKWVEKMTAEN